MAKLSASDREMGFKVKRVPIDEINVKVTVELTRQFRFKLWLGRQLLILLSRIWTAEYTLVCYRDLDASEYSLNYLREEE